MRIDRRELAAIFLGGVTRRFTKLRFAFPKQLATLHAQGKAELRCGRKHAFGRRVIARLLVTQLEQGTIGDAPTLERLLRDDDAEAAAGSRRNRRLLHGPERERPSRRARAQRARDGVEGLRVEEHELAVSLEYKGTGTIQVDVAELAGVLAVGAHGGARVLVRARRQLDPEVGLPVADRARGEGGYYRVERAHHAVAR